MCVCERVHVCVCVSVCVCVCVCEGVYLKGGKTMKRAMPSGIVDKLC